MAAPVVFRSSDSSAPVLTGAAGSLVAVLDACLVNGYTGKSAAGWSKPYTATNAAVFRMGGGNQFYLDVNDNGASNGLTGASGKEAAVRGYEVMTAASTGTGPFPTTGQQPTTDSNWRKSATADATARTWIMVADDRSFVLGILDGDVASRHKLYVFGDFYSLQVADAYRVAITVRTSVNNALVTGSFGSTLSAGGTSVAQTVGLYVARIAAGTGTANAEGMLGVGSVWDSSTLFTGALDGKPYVARLLLNDVSPIMIRGWLRGLYELLTPVGMAHGDTFVGTGELAGRSFLVVKAFGGIAEKGLAVETTQWDSSS